MRVVNKYKEPYTHYIGRGSVFGNPFEIGRDGDREQVIAMFELYAKGIPHIKDAIRELPKSAILGCFCKPKACHGDAIIKIWNELHPPMV
jgi:hypothetical protein